ncbi:hypothetical protein [Sporomusa termitida]|uniref:Uncharacterized protein n=1 Tax=Sporomusa termitida TaxID=2377 RepID=A0A517DR53_9FIRM|nr:hypothetical protein [Sporomusa termitida]QDR79852.1 hypothetical protein SPTER_11540 [Sporomusa termitida]
MAKEALHTGSKYTDGSRSAEQGAIAARIMLPATPATDKVQDNQCDPVCKAELISLATREEIRQSVALIDHLLSPYRLAKV